MTDWYRAGRSGLKIGALVNQSAVLYGDYPVVHVTSKLLVARAYAHGHDDRVVYKIRPLDEVTIVDPETGHGVCGMAKIDGIAQAGTEDTSELWRAIANCVWWDDTRMYTDDGYMNPPPGLSDSGPAGQLISTQLQRHRYLLPGSVKQLLEQDEVEGKLLGWWWPRATWLVG